MIESKDYYIDLINSSKANKMTELYHYSGVGFKKSKLNLGIYRKTDNLLVGVLQWGISAQEGIKLNRYVKEPIKKEEYLELNRFSMADSEGKNAESQAISIGIKWIKKHKPDIKLLVSYAGRKEGNYGYIYQATNWEYLGYFISDGFWLLDGEERHQMTLWNTYKKHGDQKKSFRDAICDLYNDVRQTYTKQFIYIIRLDKKLTQASDILPYPKPATEFPICASVRIYKKNEEHFNSYVKPKKENVEFYYEKEEYLFSRRTLIRQGIIKKQGIAIYNNLGELEDTCTTVIEASSLIGYSKNRISGALKTEKINGDYFFRYYNLDEEPEETIDIDYLCEIDGVRFFKQSDIAEYCGVSRQSISGSKERQSKIINGKEIIWKKV